MKFFRWIRDKWKTTRAREKEKMKDMTWKEKLQYISSAWGLEIVVGLTAVLLVVGSIKLIDNATNAHILTFAVVDSDLSEGRVKTIKQDFKKYLGDTERKNVVSAEVNIDSMGGTLEEVPSSNSHLSQQQEVSITLAVAGTIDCYLAPRKYVDFLKECEVLCSVEEALGEFAASRYSQYITEDGMALLVESEAAKEYFSFPVEEDMYLAFTVSIHYPEVTASFADFVMEK